MRRQMQGKHTSKAKRKTGKNKYAKTSRYESRRSVAKYFKSDFSASDKLKVDFQCWGQQEKEGN